MSFRSCKYIEFTILTHVNIFVIIAQQYKNMDLADCKKVWPVQLLVQPDNSRMIRGWGTFISDHEMAFTKIKKLKKGILNTSHLGHVSILSLPL